MLQEHIVKKFIFVSLIFTLSLSNKVHCQTVNATQMLVDAFARFGLSENSEMIMGTVISQQISEEHPNFKPIQDLLKDDARLAQFWKSYFSFLKKNHENALTILELIKQHGDNSPELQKLSETTILSCTSSGLRGYALTSFDAIPLQSPTVQIFQWRTAFVEPIAFLYLYMNDTQFKIFKMLYAEYIQSLRETLVRTEKVLRSIAHLRYEQLVQSTNVFGETVSKDLIKFLAFKVSDLNLHQQKRSLETLEVFAKEMGGPTQDALAGLFPLKQIQFQNYENATTCHRFFL